MNIIKYIFVIYNNIFDVKVYILQKISDILYRDPEKDLFRLFGGINDKLFI